MGRKYTAQERESQISQLCEGTIYSFAGWVDEYRNWTSKFVCLCEQHGEWTPSVNAFVNVGNRCSQCRYEKLSDARRVPKQDREKQILKQCKIKGYSFVKWVNDYVNSSSLLVCSCPEHGEWELSVNSLINKNSDCPVCRGTKKSNSEEFKNKSIEKHGDKYDYSKVIYAGANTKVTIRCHQHGDFKQTPYNHLRGQGCPGCAQSGFDQTKPSTLYAIRSDCGQYVKIGITNNFKRRFQKLKHVTPFDVSVIERIECDGQTARQFEKMFHDKFESAGFEGFDGATEWLQWSTELQYWLRLLK